MTLCEHGCGTELREVTLGYFLGPIVELYDQSGKHTPERCRDALRALLDEARRATAAAFEMHGEKCVVFVEAAEAAEKRAVEAEVALDCEKQNRLEPDAAKTEKEGP